MLMAIPEGKAYILLCKLLFFKSWLFIPVLINLAPETTVSSNVSLNVTSSAGRIDGGDGRIILGGNIQLPPGGGISGTMMTNHNHQTGQSQRNIPSNSMIHSKIHGKTFKFNNRMHNTSLQWQQSTATALLLCNEFITKKYLAYVRVSFWVIGYI